MSSSLRAVLSEVPPWVVITFWFAVFAGVSFGVRWAVRTWSGPERMEELAEHSHKLVGALAATFAFLVGFAITITWSGVGDGQSAVEDQAAHAQQLAWSLRSMGDQAAADRLLGDLKMYLTVAATEDSDMLARGAGESLPSSSSLDRLAAEVHSYAYSMGEPGPEATMIITNVQDLAMGQASIVALSQRQLPILLAVLLVISGIAMAAVAGIGAATVSRPYLLLVWCFVSALAISVAFILDHPFGGTLAVDFRPIIVVADSLPG